MRKSILYYDTLHRQIVRDYRAISNDLKNPGNICGLKNLNGTCYMNSVLQSLLFTSSLTEFFLLNKCTEDENTKNTLISTKLVAKEYSNLLYLVCRGEYTVLTPAPFKQIIGHVNRVYLGNQQQDAHEFLIFLLDCLHEDLNRARALLIVMISGGLFSYFSRSTLLRS